jgi:hypothetical protein
MPCRPGFANRELPEHQSGRAFGISEIVRFPLTQISTIPIDVPARRGAFRDRHKRWAGMRWTRQRA